MANLVLIEESLRPLFSGENPFEIVQELEGNIHRKYANRTTKEFIFNNESYFVKYHKGVGWKEIFKNIIQFKKPVLGAKQEWDALNKLKFCGINCPEPIAYYSKGINPSKKCSFIITKSLTETLSLEDLFLKEKITLSLEKKRELLKNIALISRRLHENGINHRDFYLCHFHVKKDLDFSIDNIYLIDLHRAQIRSIVPLRWSTKDIGGLFHSAMDIGLTETDCYRFLRNYFNLPLREIFKEQRSFINLSRKRAFSMYMKPILDDLNIDSSNEDNSHSDFEKGKEKDSRWIIKKQFLNDDLLEILSSPDHSMSKGKEIKLEEGNHIVSLDLKNISIYIKKFQVKGALHYIRKFFSQSRAKTAWKATFWLNAVGIKTIQPIALIENHDAFTTKESYLITLKQQGQRLDAVDLTEDLENKIVNRMASFVKRLRWIGFSHGDAKSPNFFIESGSLIASDLDVCKRSYVPFLLERKLSKDKKRILKSFKNNTKINQSLLKRF